MSLNSSRDAMPSEVASDEAPDGSKGRGRRRALGWPGAVGGIVVLLALSAWVAHRERTTIPPSRTTSRNDRALELLAAGRPEEARAFLEAAPAGSEDAGQMELLGRTYAQQGRTDEAERCWRQAERWDPRNADVCLDLGRLAMGRRRWEEAVAYFKRAADRSSDAIEPLYNLSQAYRMLDRNAEAEHYRRLADDRRRSQPPRDAGMGADVDPRD